MPDRHAAFPSFRTRPRGLPRRAASRRSTIPLAGARGRAGPSGFGVRAAHGQAAVELVALLPCAVALLAGLWQLVLIGQAAWAASTAARAAARAHAVGHDARRAARDHLPTSLEPDLRVKTADGGEVEVQVRIPTIPGLPSLGHTGSTGHFAPQS
jgi:hypothetical protein